MSDMSCEVALGSIKACHRLAAVESNVRYEASLSGLSDEMRQLPVADICQRQVWIPKPTIIRISIELGFDDEVFSTFASWPTRAMVETLANAELWSELQYDTSSEYTDPVAGDQTIRMVLCLHSKENDNDTASISTRRASHRIYNGSMPQCTQAPLGVPACNLESVKIRCRFCRHTTRASNRNQTRRRFDSGIGLSKDDPADAGDIDMLDLFDDDSDEDLFDDDSHEDLFDDDREEHHSKDDTVNELFDDYPSLASEASQARIASSAQASDEEGGTLSIRGIIDILDAAVRTILCPRLTGPSPDVKVKKDKNLVRLDELAPAALKPQALRVFTFVHSLLTCLVLNLSQAFALHSVFSPTISSILRKHTSISLDSAITRVRRDQEGNEGQQNEQGLWYLKFRKLLKGGPGVRLTPVRITDGEAILEDDSGKDPFEEMDSETFL